MDIRSLLKDIQDTALEDQTGTPYIVGGIPRDRVLDLVEVVKDIDITTGDASVHRLGRSVYRYLKPFGASFQSYPDKHSTIKLGDLRIDFSSFFINPDAWWILESRGLKHPTSMELELYSRDFTCNTLLMSLNLQDIKDLTGQGIPDIEAKLLKTCLPPQYTLGSDPKRIVRAVYLAAKLGFTLDSAMVSWIRAHPEEISKNVKPAFVDSVLAKAFSYNKDRAIAILDELNVWKYIPSQKEIEVVVAI